VAIDPFQAEVARIGLAAAAEHGFALAGGNALVAHGLLERDTKDVDLFSPEPGGPGTVAEAVREVLVGAGYTAAIIKAPEAHQGEFARLEVSQGDRVMHVDLARDWRQWPPVQLEVGPVLHIEDAVSSKTTALVTRREPRDFIDIGAALARYRRADLMRLCFTRDPGLRVVDFADSARRLDEFTTADFAEYGFDQAALDALRARFAEWPRHETDDHEGHAVHAAIAENERRRRAGERPTSTAELAGQAYPTARRPPPGGSSPVRPEPEDRPPRRSL
jgi:hypothetical protein